MKINNFRTEHTNNFSRVAATVIWENCDRSPQEIYFETTAEFADALTCDPHAFLVASIIPAMRYGEKRIYLDAEICPELRSGLMEAMGWLQQWYGGDRNLVSIEAKTKSDFTLSESPRSGFFFSGGIDSLATLRVNRLNYPLEHPRSFQDGILILGLEGHEMDSQLAGKHLSLLSQLAIDARINLIPIYTNIRDLDRSLEFWQNEFQSAVLSAVAHALSKRLSDVTIASSEYAPFVVPYGTHPLLDLNYSSQNLQIRHDSVLLSRLDKTKIIAEWNTGLQNLKVCTRNQYEALNCGRCEKCLRTMTALKAIGMLEKTRVFLRQDLSEEILVNGAYIGDEGIKYCYLETIGLLRERGEHDLIKGIQKIVNRFEEKDLKGIVKRIDRQFFQSNLIDYVKKLKQVKAKA